MAAKPPPSLEWLIGLLIPPACREEIVGDLHERYRSVGAYILDACSVVPLVVASRIRRTADPPSVLMETFAFYLAFLGSAYLHGREFLLAEYALLRLALPCAVALAGSVLYGAYAKPGARSRFRAFRGPVLGVVIASCLQSFLHYTSPHIAVPHWIMLSGAALGLLLTFALRLLFPPVTGHPIASAPAFWLKLAGEPIVIPPGVGAVLLCLGAFSAVAIVGAVTGSAPLVKFLGGAVALAILIRELNRRI